MKRLHLRLQLWTIGDYVRLATEHESPVGLIPADSPGEVVRLEFGPRVCVRFAAGDVWIEQGQLLPAQRRMLEDDL